METCENMNLDGTGWRLPTQRELYAAYEHGIRSATGDPNWMTLAASNYYFWSSTTASAGVGSAWYTHLSGGFIVDHWQG